MQRSEILPIPLMFQFNYVKGRGKVNGVQQLATSLTAMGTHVPYGITYPAEVTFLPLPQPKLVPDSATSERCKAELT